MEEAVTEGEATRLRSMGEAVTQGEATRLRSMAEAGRVAVATRQVMLHEEASTLQGPVHLVQYRRIGRPVGVPCPGRMPFGPGLRRDRALLPAHRSNLRPAATGRLRPAV
jgi:hypothetical protein